MFERHSTVDEPQGPANQDPANQEIIFPGHIELKFPPPVVLLQVNTLIILNLVKAIPHHNDPARTTNPDSRPISACRSGDTTLQQTIITTFHTQTHPLRSEPCVPKGHGHGTVTTPINPTRLTPSAARPPPPTPPPHRLARSRRPRRLLRQRARALRGRDPGLRDLRPRPHRDDPVRVPRAAPRDEFLHGGARDGGRGGPRAAAVVRGARGQEGGEGAGERAGRGAEERGH